MTTCACGHVPGLHHAGGVGGLPCRINGCSCEGFREAGAPPKRQSTRTVTFEIPDGYMLSVSLVPYAEAGDATDGPQPGEAEEAAS